MAAAPDDEEGTGQSDTAEEDWGNPDKAPSGDRLSLFVTVLLLCPVAYIIWVFFGLCAGIFGIPLYIPFMSNAESALIWCIVVIVFATILAAIFMPLDGD